jgi:Uma2 family endonuclease
MTFEEFLKLPEREGPIYELDEGELLTEASPTYGHNLIRKRIARRLDQFVEAHFLGDVPEEMDFRLGPDTVRNPDVAFVTAEHLKTIDLDRTPVEGAPALAVEVVSPTNSAQDVCKKALQYLAAGSRAVWLVYPPLRLVQIYDSTGVRTVTAPDCLQDRTAFPNLTFSLSLVEIFDPDPMRR